MVAKSAFLVRGLQFIVCRLGCDPEGVVEPCLFDHDDRLLGSAGQSRFSRLTAIVETVPRYVENLGTSTRALCREKSEGAGAIFVRMVMKCEGRS